MPSIMIFGYFGCRIINCLDFVSNVTLRSNTKEKVAMSNRDVVKSLMKEGQDTQEINGTYFICSCSDVD